MRFFISVQKSAKKSAFTNKSAQKSTLKGTFGSSAPIWLDLYLTRINTRVVRCELTKQGCII